MYISLPSDSSSELFPNNTIAAFKVKLPNTLTLDRSKSVVGLTSIEWPHSFRNITNVDFKLTYNQTESETTYRQRPLRVSIRPGYYQTPQELVDELNNKLRQVHIPSEGSDHILNGNQHCYFEFDERTETLSFLTSEDSPAQFQLHMHWKLYCKLGFALDKSANTWIKTGDKAQYVVDLDAGFSTIYVYCNIIESSRIVGSMLSPLLRILPIDRKHGEICHFEPRHVEYFPLRYDQVSEISIELRTDIGELLEFQSGKTVVNLHIKTKAFSI